MTLLDDGVETEEVKFDKPKQLELLCTCWPKEFVSKFSVSAKIGLERKRLITASMPPPTASLDKPVPTSLIAPLSEPTSVDTSVDTAAAITDTAAVDTSVTAVGAAVTADATVPKVKKAKLSTTKPTSTSQVKTVKGVPVKGTRFPKMQLPVSDEAEVGQRLYMPTFDIFEPTK